MHQDARRFAPATQRNREAILDVLLRHLPSHGMVLEIASGSGEHVTYFAANITANVEFQPSDIDPAARESVNAWANHLGLANVRPAITLDASAEAWPVQHADAVLSINMIHIAPWSTTVGLMQGAARVLPPKGPLYLYGPFRRGGRHTADSNEAFDQSLRAQDVTWGVRDLEKVAQLATSSGFAPPIVEEMPANNISLIFHRM